MKHSKFFAVTVFLLIALSACMEHPSTPSSSITPTPSDESGNIEYALTPSPVPTPSVVVEPSPTPTPTTSPSPDLAALTPEDVADLVKQEYDCYAKVLWDLADEKYVAICYIGCRSCPDTNQPEYCFFSGCVSVDGDTGEITPLPELNPLDVVGTDGYIQECYYYLSIIQTVYTDATICDVYNKSLSQLVEQYPGVLEEYLDTSYNYEDNYYPSIDNSAISKDGYTISPGSTVYYAGTVRYKGNVTSVSGNTVTIEWYPGGYSYGEGEMNSVTVDIFYGYPSAQQNASSLYIDGTNCDELYEVY